MDKQMILSLAEDVRAAADQGVALDARALAYRLSLMCLSDQQSDALDYIRAESAPVSTGAVSGHLGVTVSHAAMILAALLRAGLVERAIERDGTPGRPESRWRARVPEAAITEVFSP